MVGGGGEGARSSGKNSRRADNLFAAESIEYDGTTKGTARILSYTRPTSSDSFVTLLPRDESRFLSTFLLATW